MNFLLNVIRIFFRNKWSEIKKMFHTRGWTDFLEGLIFIGIAVVVFAILGLFCHLTGWVIVDVLEWIDVVSDRDEPVPLAVVGFAVWFSFMLFSVVTFGIGKFFKWIWLNIKAVEQKLRDWGNAPH